MIITDNFLYWDILRQVYLLLTLKVPLQFWKSPKDKNEELLFPKLQFNSFSLNTTFSCSDSTLPVYGIGPKVALTCEITLSKIRAAHLFLYRVDSGITFTPHLSSSLNGFRLCKSVCCHLREQRSCSELTIQLMRRSNGNFNIPSPPRKPRAFALVWLDGSNYRPVRPKWCSNALPYRRILFVKCPS